MAGDGTAQSRAIFGNESPRFGQQLDEVVDALTTTRGEVRVARGLDRGIPAPDFELGPGQLDQQCAGIVVIREAVAGDADRRVVAAFGTERGASLEPRGHAGLWRR